MPQIKVYHNPSFLSYQGNHTQIPLINQLVATVTISDELTAPQALDIAFAQTQHFDVPWYHNLGVLPHLRSTSVADLLADDNGRFFVVERCGFQPYQPPSPAISLVTQKQVSIAWLPVVCPPSKRLQINL